jgi:hypothetical protein
MGAMKLNKEDANFGESASDLISDDEDLSFEDSGTVNYDNIFYELFGQKVEDNSKRNAP